MRTPKSVIAAVPAVILGLAVIAAGCSNNVTPPTTTTTTTAAPTTTTTTTVPPTTTSSSSTTSTSTTTSTTQSAAAASCVVGQLKLVALQGTGAAGTIYNPVEVVNTSITACSLDGRPVVTLTGAVQGAKEGKLPTTVQSTGEGSTFSMAPSSLTLPPNGAGTVGFLVQSSDVPSDGEQTCPVVSSLSVTLPGTNSALSVPATFTACGGPTISVSAIVKASALQSD